MHNQFYLCCIFNDNGGTHWRENSFGLIAVSIGFFIGWAILITTFIFKDLLDSKVVIRFIQTIDIIMGIIAIGYGSIYPSVNKNNECKYPHFISFLC